MNDAWVDDETGEQKYCRHERAGTVFRIPERWLAVAPDGRPLAYCDSRAEAQAVCEGRADGARQEPISE